jgi:hypothetical protein
LITGGLTTTTRNTSSVVATTANIISSNRRTNIEARWFYVSGENTLCLPLYIYLASFLNALSQRLVFLATMRAPWYDVPHDLKIDSKY